MLAGYVSQYSALAVGWITKNSVFSSTKRPGQLSAPTEFPFLVGTGGSFLRGKSPRT